MNPTEAKYKYDFTLNGKSFSAGLYELDAAKWPDILTPILFINEAGKWSEVARFDTIWSDLKEDVNPDLMATLIVKKFNEALKQYGGVGELSWNQKLGAIFQMRMALVDGKLIVKSA